MNNELDVRIVPISRVFPDLSQPRKAFDKDKLEQLSDSISKYGVLTPLSVRMHELDGTFEIIAGERRWRAAKIAGLKEIPVKIENVDDLKKIELSIIENIQRVDLNSVEEAKAYKRLMDNYNLTQEEVAARVCKSRAYVSNVVRLLKLPEDVLNYIIEDKLSYGHARALISLNDDRQIKETADKIIADDMSVRETEKYVKKLQTKKKGMKKKNLTDDEYAAIVESIKNDLIEYTGTKVDISYNKNHAGYFKIEFYSDDDFERIVDKLKK